MRRRIKGVGPSAKWTTYQGRLLPLLKSSWFLKAGTFLLLCFTFAHILSSPQQDLLAAIDVESQQPFVNYHVVFSTGCSKYQDWQSYVFFYHAMKSKQPGTVTRIVSGCNDVDEQALQKIFDEQIVPMAPSRFKIHFTPDYSNLTETRWPYVYFNKPFGMRHWMQSSELSFPDNPVDEDAIIILMDPDQIILRPFTNNNFTNSEWIGFEQNPPVRKPRTKIEHGAPMGQLFGLSNGWKRINMTLVVPGEPSPIDSLSDADAYVGYNVGPPYIATARDMYKIVLKWCDFSVPVYKQYPQLLAEMYSYSLSAAHQRMPHQTATSFMVSDARSPKEGWPYVNRLKDDEVCNPKSPEDLPNVLHFCQRYGLGDYFFYKRNMPGDILSCSAPLLREPTTEELNTNEVRWPDGKSETWSVDSARYHRFMLCGLIRSMNAALTHYKENHCEASEANYERTFSFRQN